MVAKTRVQCLALDCGASSCRLIGVGFKENVLHLNELTRIKNAPAKDGDSFFWRHEYLFAEVVKGLCKAGVNGESFASIGVDTWGVDYLLLDEENKLLQRPVAYRDGRTKGMIERFTRTCLSKEQIYEKTGIQFLPFNTLYQLYSQTLTEPELLSKTHRLLFTSDYFHFLLSGRARIEKTMASTSQLWNIKEKCWDHDLLDQLALPKTALQTPLEPGTEIGGLSLSLRKKTGLSTTRVITPASHDTASAVLAVPAVDDDWAFLSSGTWSLLGVESTTPISGPEAMAANWTNEGGFGNTYRFLRNISGLWIIQEIIRNLPERHCYADLAAMAEAEPGFVSLIDPDNVRFFNPDNMIGEIRNFCRTTGQVVPGSPGALARCAYDSLSLLYRKTFGDLCLLSGRDIKVLHVVGGGSQASFLNQLIASAIGMPVMAGPVEAAVLGNALAQFLATGVISDVASGRALIGRTFPPKRFEPKPISGIDKSYKRFLALQQEMINS